MITGFILEDGRGFFNLITEMKEHITILYIVELNIIGKIFFEFNNRIHR